MRHAIVWDRVAPMLKQPLRVTGRRCLLFGAGARPGSCGRFGSLSCDGGFRKCWHGAVVAALRLHGDLVHERDFALLARGLQHGKTDFERGHRPFAIVQGSAPVNDCVIDLVDDFGTRDSGPW
jgi:hypothetical protein